MKNVNKIMVLSFSILLFISCKKNGPEKAKQYDVVSFTFNGQTYERSGLSVAQGRFENLYLWNPEKPGWGAYFKTFPSNCAFYIPDNTGYQLSSNCELSFPGMPVDSSQIYFYRSGSMNYCYSNCEQLTDVVTGIVYSQCTVSGNFALTLGNNNNQTISFTNGSFVFHKVMY